MKALVYETAHELAEFAVELAEIAEPVLRSRDVLVEVRAIGINPGEAAIRRSRSAEPGGRVLLGWEFAGTVVEAGPLAGGFAPGEWVFGTGDITRDGAWAERVAVDHRLLARVPDHVSFSDAASLPIGTLTSWEAVFRDQAHLPGGIERVLVVGGAGAVGSMTTQLLKARTDATVYATVYATASRPEPVAWSRRMGADTVLDHSRGIPAQLAEIDVASVDMVVSTARTTEHLDWIVQVLRPFGHLTVVDGAGVDASPLVGKSITLHTELVFTRILHDADPQHQGAILDLVAGDLVGGRLQPIATTHLEGLTVETMRNAHEMAENGHVVGKIVVTV